MATIQTPRLDIRLNLSTATTTPSANIRVSGTVKFNLEELNLINNLGGTFTVHATVRGDDVGSNDPVLVNMGSQTIAAPAQSIMPFTLNQLIDASELDEDGPIAPADDLFALISVTNNDNGAQTSVRTNTIKHQFRVFV